MVDSSPVKTVQILVAMLCVVGCTNLTAQPDELVETSTQLNGVRVRLMAGNLSAGTRQSYDSGEGARIIKGLKPDVLMLQEFNVGDNGPDQVRAFVDSICGTTCAYARGAPAQIPNGVISRYPIIASGDWADPHVSNRAFTWAHIDVPGSVDLWAISVHLLTSGTSNRRAEAQALVSAITKNVPANDYIVIGGDFNTSSRTEQMLSTLGSVVVTSGPFPVDGKGDSDTNVGRSKAYDWVVVSPNLSALATPTVIGSSSFANGLVADTRIYQPISDLAPALPRDSAAPNMQHMAVVRDFDLQGFGPPTRLQVKSPNGGENFEIGSSQTIRWSGGEGAQVNVDYSSDGVSFNSIAKRVDAALGAIGWTVPAPATSQGVIRISTTDSAVVDTSNAAFSVSAIVSPAKVVINEILANELGSAIAGEFVEFFNAGSTSADLSGWSVSDGVSVRHLFAPGTTIEPGALLVVFGASSGIPSGLNNAVGASTGTLSFGNSADTVTLTNTSGAVVDSFTYSSSLASTDGVSMNRSPDQSSSAPFALHSTLSSLKTSPGTAADGTP